MFRTRCGVSEFRECPGGDGAGWPRCSSHQRDTNRSVPREEPSSLWLLELQGFAAPVKWTIFALWPNLQGQKRFTPGPGGSNLAFGQNVNGTQRHRTSDFDASMLKVCFESPTLKL